MGAQDRDFGTVLQTDLTRVQFVCGTGHIVVHVHVEYITTEPDIAGSISRTGNTWGLKITDKHSKS